MTNLAHLHKWSCRQPSVRCSGRAWLPQAGHTTKGATEFRDHGHRSAPGNTGGHSTSQPISGASGAPQAPSFHLFHLALPARPRLFPTIAGCPAAVLPLPYFQATVPNPPSPCSGPPSEIPLFFLLFLSISPHHRATPFTDREERQERNRAPSCLRRSERKNKIK